MLPVECTKIVALVRVTCLLHNCETNVSGFAKLAEKITNDLDEQERRVKYLQNLYSESRSSLKRGITVVNKSEKHLNQVLKLAGFKSYDAFVQTWDKVGEYIITESSEVAVSQVPVCILYHSSTAAYLNKFLGFFGDHLSLHGTSKTEEDNDSKATLNELLEQHNFVIWVPALDTDGGTAAATCKDTKRVVPVWLESPMIAHPVIVSGLPAEQTISGLNELGVTLVFLDTMLETLSPPATPTKPVQEQAATNISHFENTGTVIVGHNTQFNTNTMQFGNSSDTIHNYGNTSSNTKGQ